MSSPRPIKVYLDADEKTYWTLLVHSSTRGADIVAQLAAKLQLTASAVHTLSLGTVVREAAGGVLRSRVAPTELLLPVCDELARAAGDAKFVVAQRDGVGDDARLLARQVVLDGDELLVTPRGSLHTVNAVSDAIKKSRRRGKATVAAAPTATPVAAINSVGAVAGSKEKSFAEYEFSSDDEAHARPSQPPLRVSIAPVLAGPAPPGSPSSPVSVAPPPSAVDSLRHSRRKRPQSGGHAPVTAAAAAAAAVAESSEDSGEALRLTPPKASPVLDPRRMRRRGTADTATLSSSTASVAVPAPLSKVASAAAPKHDGDGDSENDDGGDGDESGDETLKRFCSHTLATRLSAERRSALAGAQHRQRAPWMTQCCIERLFSRAAFEARNLLEGDQVSLSDVNALAEQFHACASNNKHAAVVQSSDVRVAAALLLTYLQRLPDCVVPGTALPAFVDAAVREGDEQRRVRRLARLVDALPATNRALLGDVVHWAVQWTAFAPKKKPKTALSLADVASILAPILLGQSDEDASDADRVAVLSALFKNATPIVGPAFYGAGDLIAVVLASHEKFQVDAQVDAGDNAEVSWNPFVGPQFSYTYNPFA
jgi:hypothetical protein